MQGFGFIPDKAYEQNPDGLPVGFARDDRFVDPYTGQKLIVLGITCAGLSHRRTLLWREGDPDRCRSIPDQSAEIHRGPRSCDYLDLLRSIALPPICGPGARSRTTRTPIKRGCVRRSSTISTQLSPSSNQRSISFLRPEGYGRTDALARIGNFVFGTELNNNKNLVVGNAPVNYPPIWDASWMDWVQYNGSIQQPMGTECRRGAGRAFADQPSWLSRSAVPEHDSRGESARDRNSARRRSEPGKGVWSPKWPEDILGKIDRGDGSQGRATLQPTVPALPPAAHGFR